MRRFVRTDAPEVLKEHGQRWTEQWVTLKSRNASAQFNWYQHDRCTVRDLILDDLRSMTNGHCAFCDRFTVEPESVEHFRPKSDTRFLHLAYEWSNLYFCCGGCQNYKREQWDDALLHADAADFEFFRYFNFDFETGQIFPNPTASAGDQQRAEVTIRIYGLDAPERRRFRKLERRQFERTLDPNINDFGYRDFVRDP